MYEETKSSIDWKGLTLKVIIAFLVVLIGFKAYTTLKGNDNKKVTTSQTVAESKSSSTFTANIEKLRNAGEKYFKENKDKLPETNGNTTMITLNELINAKVISTLSDEEGKTCDGESSYVTATSEGEKTKIKANLVCGNASSYSLVYMGENDSEEKTETKTETSTSKNSSTSTSTKTSSTSSSSKKTSTTTNTCGTSCATPSVTVNTDTKVSQTVTINKDNTSKKENVTNNDKVVSNNNKVTKYYTVNFDSNGGSTDFASQKVKENNTAFNPGNPYRNGYSFVGWYLNGTKYDFSTPVTRNITLVAEYLYDSDLNDNIFNNNINNYNKLYPATDYTYVYTMGWDTKGTDYIEIKHKLKVPKEIERSKYDIEKIKISDIEFYSAIDTVSLANIYREKHKSTFLYDGDKNWSSKVNTTSSLATIKSRDVEFDYSSRYKDFEDALDEGFDVTWIADDVYEQCSKSFSVNGETNKCNYGIIYRVEWTYQYYK